nr:TcR V13J2.1 beta chain {clone Mouse6A8, complementarity determining region 3} [mice, CBA/J, induced autoimmune thyroiditic, thyroid, Peptide Partial, 15 aa] [Mus sp.]
CASTDWGNYAEQFFG